MADTAPHDDHGNTPAAWTMVVLWIIGWAVAGVGVLFGGSLVLWTGVALASTVVAAVVGGIMKKMGFGKKPAGSHDEHRTADAVPASAQEAPEPAGAR